MRLSKEFRFEASHVLPKHPGKCSRLHGHSWILKVSVDGRVDPDSGFVKDYAEISRIVKPLIERLDHRHLGAWAVYNIQRPSWKEDPRYVIQQAKCIAEITGAGYEDREYFDDWKVPGLPLAFNPTSENLIKWIGGELWHELKWSQLELNETCTSGCILTREEFDAGKD